MIGVLVGCHSLTVPAMAPALAATTKKQGSKQGSAQRSQPQSKPQARPQSAQSHSKAAPTRAGTPTAKASSNVNRPKSTSYGSKPGQKQVSNQTAYKAGQASSNRNQKDVVVVGGGGYNNNGYNNGRYYEDDDDDFLEFVGKTAAITAGVSVVAAVIGSSTKEKPDDCQPVNANGQSYMFCNGTYYQQSGPTSQPTYTVVAPPQ
jgi:hypothetical protein